MSIHNVGETIKYKAGKKVVRIDGNTITAGQMSRYGGAYLTVVGNHGEFAIGILNGRSRTTGTLKYKIIL